CRRRLQARPGARRDAIDVDVQAERVVMRRGEIWWAQLPVPDRSGPGFRRPVLVVQSDAVNRSGIATVVVATITSNAKRAEAPRTVLLGPAPSGLPKASAFTVSHPPRGNKTRLVKAVAALPSKEMTAVDDGIRLVLGL